MIWFSERDNWGQLYLYDLATGKLKNQITTGDGQRARRCCAWTRRARMLYFPASGREQGRDPYFRHFYRVGFDGKNSRC